MWIEQIFYLAFASQILLISYYYPKRILSQVDYVFTHFPADKYAKLYPKGYTKTLAVKNLFKLINVVILISGFIILGSLIIAHQQNNILIKDMDFFPLAYGMLQGVPLLILELSGLKNLKLMRNLNNQTKRQAELHPRSIFNYVSVTRFFSAIIIFIICIYVMFRFNNFEMSFDIATLLGALVLCNGLFIGLGYVMLHGKKLNPHQTPQDRHNMTKATFHSYTSVSILVSAFFIINRCVEHYALADWEPLINSLYWQALILVSTGSMLRLNRAEEIDYDVYKTSASNRG